MLRIDWQYRDAPASRLAQNELATAHNAFLVCDRDIISRTYGRYRGFEASCPNNRRQHALHRARCCFCDRCFACRRFDISSSQQSFQGRQLGLIRNHRDFSIERDSLRSETFCIRAGRKRYDLKCLLCIGVGVTDDIQRRLSD